MRVKKALKKKAKNASHIECRHYDKNSKIIYFIINNELIYLYYIYFFSF